MLSRLFTRMRELDPAVADAGLAAAFATAGVIESILVNSGGHSRLLTGTAAVAMAVAVGLRRRNPLVAVVLFVAIAAVAAPLNTFLFSTLTTPFVMVLVIAYSIGRHETGSRVWMELVLLALVVPVTGGIRTPGDVLWTAVFIVCPALAGRAIRNRTLFQREMREKAARLQAERELRASRAVEDERQRIASELQVVVANDVSAMVVQAEALPKLLEAGDRATAGQALAVIEDTGREALAEMRRLLGVLRRDGEGPALAPQPTLAQAEALLARARDRGLQTTITVEGEAVAVSPGVDLAGYRVLEEALTNAARDGGASRADVSIVYGDAGVLIRIRDDRESTDGPDAELPRALRERVNLYGGTLRVSPQREPRGLEVEARLPVGGTW